ncbi:MULTISPECIES: hypothetical protein [Enterobacterales]|uniref:hypothetical protein n=1 Tax=Enterobacterales TaxID=91347 RepID=UPI002ED8DBFA
MLEQQGVFELFCEKFTALCDDIRAIDDYSREKVFTALNSAAETDILSRCQEKANWFIEELEFLPPEGKIKYVTDPSDPFKPRYDWFKECFEGYISHEIEFAYLSSFLNSNERSDNGVKLIPKSVSDYYLLFSFYYYEFGRRVFYYKCDDAYNYISEALRYIKIYISENSSCRRDDIDKDELKAFKHMIHSSKGGRAKSKNESLVIAEVIRLADDFHSAHRRVIFYDVLKSISEDLRAYIDKMGINLGVNADLFDKIQVWYKRPEVKNAIDTALKRTKKR